MGYEGWDFLNRLSYWLLRLIYANLLWAVFTVLGFVALGIFPSTAALLTVTKKWIREGDDFSIFPLFWRAFRKNFVQANGLGWLFTAAGLLLYMNVQVVHQQKQWALFSPLLYVMIVMYIAVCFFILPVIIHFELPFFQSISQAFSIALTHPQEVLQILVSILAFLLFLLIVPGLIPLFSVSVLAYLTMLFCIKAFDKQKEHHYPYEETE